MKIRSIEAVRLELPVKAITPARRPSYNQSARRAFPINKYPEFPRQLRKIPGEVAGEMWVKVTAEDGTWGMGTCHWGNLVEPLVREHYAPLLVGRD
jgi:L-rhamnonate dehydratase